MIKNILIGIAAGIVVLIGYSFVGSKTEVFNIGSVVQSGEYLATTTSEATAATGWLAKAVSGGGTCTLGSIVVASSSPTSFTLMNATSTSDVSSTTIVTFPADIPEGTYTYDISCSRGLFIVAPAGFDGTYTTTYR